MYGKIKWYAGFLSNLAKYTIHEGLYVCFLNVLAAKGFRFLIFLQLITVAVYAENNLKIKDLESF